MDKSQVWPALAGQDSVTPPCGRRWRRIRTGWASTVGRARSPPAGRGEARPGILVWASVGRAESICGQCDPGRRGTTPFPKHPTLGLPARPATTPSPTKQQYLQPGQKKRRRPEERSWRSGSPTRPQAGPGPVERSQPPRPARGRPAQKGPLFPGVPGGCEPPGKAPARNSSCGLGRSCPTPAPATQPPRRKARSPSLSAGQARGGSHASPR